MRLSQYEDGPPIELKQATARPVSIASWKLEDVLKSRLSCDGGGIEIQTRMDANLTDASRPSVPIETITGVWEDTLCNPDLEVTVWEASNDSLNASDDTNKQCECSEIHSEWKRLPIKGSIQPTGDLMDDAIDAKWVDVRNANGLSLKTPGACCHFLRGLLKTSHASLPWGDNGSNDVVMPSVVGLVLPDEVAPTLSSFRTGDACPSYFLHSVSQLQLPTSAPATWWSLGEQEMNGGGSAVVTATLLVYRTIPPRDKISVEYPLEKATKAEPLVDGCLWERYPKHEDEEDNDEEIKHEHSQGEEEDCRMLCPPYISHTQDYPGLLEPLLEHFSTLVQEALSIPRWTAWPERQHYRSSTANGDDDVACWTVFPLCHCFPANLVENRKWIDVTCAHVPQTVALLKEKLGDTLRTALFSRLDPETTLEAHTGWQDLANHVMRVHIPLVVPDGGLCGTWVDGCVETHQEGRPLCFDDAKVHRAFNYSKQERIVLILDLARPSYLPLGHATGGHTEELDGFISSLT